MKRKLFMLATLHLFFPLSVAAESILSRCYYHRDKIWEVMSIRYLFQKHNSSHFKGYFRFPKKSIRTLIGGPPYTREFVPNISYAIPGDIGFCILLMRLVLFIILHDVIYRNQIVFFFIMTVMEKNYCKTVYILIISSLFFILLL